MAPGFRAQDGDEKVRLQASQDRGTAQYFGERALLNNEPRAATVKVTSKDAKALEPCSYVNGMGEWETGGLGCGWSTMILRYVNYINKNDDI
jgi:hypothetical protein